MKEKRFRSIIANIVIVATIGVLGVAVAFSIASTPSDGTNSVSVNGAIYKGESSVGAVSLMVNVYEGGDYALEMARLLSERGFATTFFVGGKWVERHPDALLRLASYGMEIGNHGYLHRDHSKLNLRQNKDEILLCQKLVALTLHSLSSDGKPYQSSGLFAPPSGAIGNAMFSACAELDYKVVLWTRDTIDWRDHDADVIYSRAINCLASGDLILMHPTAATLAALPRILDYVVSSGLRVSPVSDLIG